jgi:hypothetical protein
MSWRADCDIRHGQDANPYKLEGKNDRRKCCLNWFLAINLEVRIQSSALSCERLSLMHAVKPRIWHCHDFLASTGSYLELREDSKFESVYGRRLIPSTGGITWSKHRPPMKTKRYVADPQRDLPRVQGRGSTICLLSTYLTVFALPSSEANN